MQGTQANLHALEGQLSALLADPQGIGQQAAMRQRAAVQVDEASAAHAETARLRLVAPFAGVWSDIDPQRRAGQWIGTDEALGVLYVPSHWRVDAYVRQDDVSRMAVGDRVHFYPKGSARRYDGTVTAIAGTRASQLDWPVLADRYGGPIATTQQKEGLVPRLPVFHVVVELHDAPVQALEAPGEVQVSGDAAACSAARDAGWPRRSCAKAASDAEGQCPIRHSVAPRIHRLLTCALPASAAGRRRGTAR
ncbi:HlyD family secretion protein [Stenotrophomonas sp. HITSZ_GD]|uniref:HlyD family secretion protein n=1 Tax=Stenotrophomonas sp. HITSZ_GD TaxID=3037248 RepID=UPI00240E927D|nr:HlyD family secretion protein [Stenotrophomonas sp. HITSZ_GD]MDG2524133.1 HlyD family secretion protein [Stenotrophomonas sp. HITSZ_GD]